MKESAAGGFKGKVASRRRAVPGRRTFIFSIIKSSDLQPVFRLPFVTEQLPGALQRRDRSPRQQRDKQGRLLLLINCDHSMLGRRLATNEQATVFGVFCK
jgi:hypothetical protein